MHDQPRGVFYDAAGPRVIGSVYGACDVMSLPLPLGDAFSKIGDYNVWTKFYDINIVDGQVCCIRISIMAWCILFAAR